MATRTAPKKKTAEHPSLTRIRDRAAQLGFTCQETEWKGYHAVYAFTCSVGHQFERYATSLVYKDNPAPCPHCEHTALRERILDMAAERGGVCLDDDYLGPEVRHRMRCQHGHEWQALGRKLLEGSWCHSCARETINAKRRANGWHIEDLQAKAQEHGGRCLSTEYLGPLERYELECAHGHRWSSVGAELMRGTWCRLCAHREMSHKKTDPEGLARIRAAAQAKGGICLDETYLGQAARYRFQCKEGHVWITAGQNILNGAWCRQCFAESRRLGLEAMQALAHERGGRCLSEAYAGVHSHLTWECHRGHVWRATPGSVKNAGHWCPSCAILNSIRAKNQYKRKRYECAPGPAD
ncbi:hypothetical protein HFK85_21860 [Ralstonia pseudosolanacearum]|uniref:hypothetical protein n=1 Tax=Ralstonia pseudosolanacearum TaxID=1310165 RepID=UPI00200578F1|nr:hypothetical protein [Ralstonia pseudosolanacearum]MCK4139995.1 hypothetical protein [Ralstonia pseudosolanacearum]